MSGTPSGWPSSEKSPKKTSRALVQGRYQLEASTASGLNSGARGMGIRHIVEKFSPSPGQSRFAPLHMCLSKLKAKIWVAEFEAAHGSAGRMSKT